MTKYELTPADNRKSFYGKCYVVNEKGIKTLYSYNVPIIKMDKKGNLFRIWAGWSLTTGRHIFSFCGLNKKEFEALPMAKSK